MLDFNYTTSEAVNAHSAPLFPSFAHFAHLLCSLGMRSTRVGFLLI